MKPHLRIFALATFLLAFINIGKAQETEDETYKKILTPLGHQPDNSNLVHETIWTDDEVEHCKQVWLYGGGVFKLESGSFKEKNNYLDNHKVLCMAIDENNIYIGTEYGIYLSTDLGASWQTQAEDGIDNLPDRKINALLIGLGRIFVGTDNGLYISTNSGVEWEQKLQYKNITCIEFGDGNDVYAGAAYSGVGVYKSEEKGDTWGSSLFTNHIYSLKYNSPDLYAGYSDGLKKSTNEGLNWDDVFLEYNNKVLSIFIDGLKIYIGTYSNGFYCSTNGGQSFNRANANLPAIDPDAVWYCINSIHKYNSMLYVATDYGIYKSYINNISWSQCNIYYPDSPLFEKFAKQLYVYNNQGTDELWVVCSCEKEKWYESAEMITDKEEPMNPSNFPNYLCHTYAWHLIEGGESGLYLSNPTALNYIPENETETNWDYIKCEWDDIDMDKVTFDMNHSAIKSNNDNVSKLEDLFIESKWGVYGPLVRHKFFEHPYSSASVIKFWKSRKKVIGDIITNQCIGREIYTKKETSVISTRIPNGSTVDMYVAPMNNHQIHLQSGFHAEKGCNFHAFVKDYYLDNEEKKPCKIPWEEEASKSEDYLVINEYKNHNYEVNITDNIIEEFTLNNSKEKNKIKFDTIPCQYEKHEFKYSGKGSGTKEDPYQITNIHQFQEMSDDFDGDHYWVLMNDIDASETRYWNPVVYEDDTVRYYGFHAIIGRDVRELDGRGHIIKNIFTTSCIIGSTNCFTLKRIGFDNLNIVGFNGDVKFFCMSYDEIDFVMEECYITGEILDSNCWQNNTSYGLGKLFNNAIVRNCYVDIVIKSKTDSSISHFGKIYSLPWNDSIEAKIENCYATGQAISARIKSPFGYEGNVLSCFWDSDKIKVNQGLGKGTGLPTSEMMKRSTFEYAGWDFENVWYIEEGKDYPKLRAFKRETEIKEEPAIEDFELSLHKVPNSNLYEIEYSVPHPCQLELKVINSMGQVVSVLSENPFHREGRYRTTFDGSSHSSGVYLIVLSTANNIIYRKLMVVR